jgi:hypothetical protein
VVVKIEPWSTIIPEIVGGNIRIGKELNAFQEIRKEWFYTCFFFGTLLFAGLYVLQWEIFILIWGYVRRRYVAAELDDPSCDLYFDEMLFDDPACPDDIHLSEENNENWESMEDSVRINEVFESSHADRNWETFDGSDATGCNAENTPAREPYAQNLRENGIPVSAHVFSEEREESLPEALPFFVDGANNNHRANKFDSAVENRSSSNKPSMCTAQETFENFVSELCFEDCFRYEEKTDITCGGPPAEAAERLIVTSLQTSTDLPHIDVQEFQNDHSKCLQSDLVSSITNKTLTNVSKGLLPDQSFSDDSLDDNFFDAQTTFDSAIYSPVTETPDYPEANNTIIGRPEAVCTYDCDRITSPMARINIDGSVVEGRSTFTITSRADSWEDLHW